MAQCFQCGAENQAQAQFCQACGWRLGSAGEPSPPPRTPRWHGGRRVVMTFLGVIAIIAIIFVIGMIYFIRHTSIVTSTKSGGRVESPFGVVTANNNPTGLARALGLQIFPGAVGEKGTQVQLASGSTIVSLNFRAAATPREVTNYYHIRYPDATVKAHGNTITLVQINLRDTMTIKASPAGDHTEIEVSDVQH